MIAVPLKSNGTVIGVLDLFGSSDFGDDDLATIRTFASQATVAVDNVLLHEEAQRLSITDGLTGLWNYRYFTLTVSKEIEPRWRSSMMRRTACASATRSGIVASRPSSPLRGEPIDLKWTR